MPGFRKIIGTGGIGAGVVYRLSGNHDLGRNESRPATLLDQKDYCKLHIIFHYVARLLREWQHPAEVIPIGAVGDDDTGRRLLAEMQTAGMNLRYVATLKNAHTLFGTCFVFPDGSGGNLTEKTSASSLVSPAAIRAVEAELTNQGETCLVMAAPEIPLRSRAALVRLGRKHGAFTAASFVSEELVEPEVVKLLHFVDLLAINIDEAAMLAGSAGREKTGKIVKACIRKLVGINPQIKLSLTNVRYGAYAYSQGELSYLPALKVRAANTAGAGDAAFAGLIIGLATGLPFISETELSCFRLSRLLAAMSVTSVDTINFAINAASLRDFARAHGELSLLQIQQR
jgi:sugar/nucleoside kinase (ribokinase family)